MRTIDLGFRGEVWKGAESEVDRKQGKSRVPHTKEGESWKQGSVGTRGCYRTVLAIWCMMRVIYATVNGKFSSTSIRKVKRNGWN